jgi:hypothetical protein
VIALALEWMSSDVLATVEGAERSLGLPVLGAIPAASPTRDRADTARPVRVGETG